MAKLQKLLYGGAKFLGLDLWFEPALNISCSVYEKLGEVPRNVLSPVLCLLASCKPLIELRSVGSVNLYFFEYWKVYLVFFSNEVIDL